MKYFLILILILFLNNCSLNKDSKYWTDESIKSKDNDKVLSQVLKKPKDITTMSISEYEIFIDEYTKKSKYPDISK